MTTRCKNLRGVVKYFYYNYFWCEHSDIEFKLFHRVITATFNSEVTKKRAKK